MGCHCKGRQACLDVINSYFAEDTLKALIITTNQITSFPAKFRKGEPYSFFMAQKHTTDGVKNWKVSWRNFHFYQFLFCFDQR